MLLYWSVGGSSGQPKDGSGQQPAAGPPKRKRKHREAEVPGSTPMPLGEWRRRFRQARFLSISASGAHVLALSADGMLYSWLHGVTSPHALQTHSARGVSAIAAGASCHCSLPLAVPCRSSLPLLPTAAPRHRGV